MPPQDANPTPSFGGFGLNRHPSNMTLSIMSYASVGTYCEPQAYDIVAVTALYKSR